MKTAELREQSSEELRKRGNELRSEKFNLRLQQANLQLEKPSRFQEVRKELARIETILSERALGVTPASK